MLESILMFWLYLTTIVGTLGLAHTWLIPQKIKQDRFALSGMYLFSIVTLPYIIQYLISYHRTIKINYKQNIEKQVRSEVLERKLNEVSKLLEYRNVNNSIDLLSRLATRVPNSLSRQIALEIYKNNDTKPSDEVLELIHDRLRLVTSTDRLLHKYGEK